MSMVLLHSVSNLLFISVLLFLDCFRYIHFAFHFQDTLLSMAAIECPASSLWIRVQDRHLDGATSSQQHKSTKPNQILSLETITSAETRGMRRSRERPTRPSHRVTASSSPLESTSPAVSIDKIGSTESVPVNPVKLSTSTNHESWKIRWQEIDLPQELLQVPAGTRQEIYAIVRESFNQARAIRASLLEPNKGQEQPATTQTDRNKSLLKSELQNHDSSIMSRERTGSSHSDATASSYDSHRFSTGGRSFDSFTSAESILNLPSTLHMVPLSPSLCAYEPQLEKHSKRHGLFSKLLRGKEPKLKTVAIKSSTSVTVVEAEKKECASCFDDISSDDAIGLACQHSYCSPCFVQLVSTAMQHENFWPPKCCLQDIPKRIIEKNLSTLELTNYSLKAREYAIPAGERWYCSRAKCGKWFERTGTRKRDVIVTCTHCSFEMCLFCRGEKHAAGERCPQDRGLEATLAAADLEGWRRCYSCHTMVELNRGCRHITCTCGAQFWYEVLPYPFLLDTNCYSYTCGLRWRTCGCTEEDQIRRRDELAARRAVANAEEAEVKAAIKAVAEAERREIEEAMERERRLREIAEQEERERAAQEEARLAEEMQRLERLEAVRVEAISTYYVALRKSLNEIHQAQRKAISVRHTAEMGNTRHVLEEIASKEVALLDEQNKEKSAWEEKIKAAQLKNAQEIIETFTRHRANQDQYFSKFAESSKEVTIDEISKAHMIEELAMIQESEREALRLKHSRDIRKLYVRAADAQSIDLTVQKRALEQEKQAATQAVEQLNARMYSDSKWLELLSRDREAMLTENEYRLMSSGADLPKPLEVAVQGFSDSSDGVSQVNNQAYRLRRGEGRQQMPAIQADWIMAQ